MLVEQTKHWQKRINLVARDSLDDIWWRHIFDSAQLFELAPKESLRWVDLGAGGGFPGLVLAALLKERVGSHIVLVESIAKKCTFLRETARKMGVSAEIIHGRIEEIPNQKADVVVARACAPLASLLDFLVMHWAEGGIGLFPKGRTVAQELTDAEALWTLKVDLHPSLTDPESRVVCIHSVERR